MNKDAIAIARIKRASEIAQARGMGPLYVGYSGGKDSTVLADLAIRAGVPIEIAHSHTTIDAPETVYFVRREMARFEANSGVKCTVYMPRYKGKPVSMWTLIPQKLMPPTRIVRYCTSVLKQSHSAGRFSLTGVRWDESVRRKKTRGIFEAPHRDPEKRLRLTSDQGNLTALTEAKGELICNPIVDWTEADVWDYIRGRHLPYNPLYDEGCTRVGCIGCPMAGKHRWAEFARWPAYKKLYIMAFDRMLEELARTGKMKDAWRWNMETTGRDVFHWWMEDGVIPGQIEMEDLLREE